jgi:hypothetical protein
MKNRHISAAICIILILLVLTPTQIMAAPVSNVQDSYAKTLVSLGLMSGGTISNLKLQTKLKRYEFIALINSTMSFDVEADAKNTNITFKDLSKKHKAYNDIVTAATHGIISAYSDKTIRPDKYITEGEAVEMILKALGYKTSDNSDASFLENLKTADMIGLSKDCELASGRQLIRGKAAIMIYNTLTIDFANN